MISSIKYSRQKCVTRLLEFLKIIGIWWTWTHLWRQILTHKPHASAYSIFIRIDLSESISVVNDSPIWDSLRPGFDEAVGCGQHVVLVDQSSTTVVGEVAHLDFGWAVGQEDHEWKLSKDDVLPANNVEIGNPGSAVGCWKPIPSSLEKNHYYY